MSGTFGAPSLACSTPSKPLLQEGSWETTEARQSLKVTSTGGKENRRYRNSFLT